MKKLLDFLVIGSQKSATTSLDKYLRLHPDVEMPDKIKELHFFDRPQNFSKGNNFYLPYFSNADPTKKWGECTPIYCYWEGVIPDIFRYNPDTKLILILRNPIHRAFSHWNMELTHKREHLSFYEALTEEKIRLSDMPHKQHRVYSYLDRGHYVSQIQNIFAHFNKESLLVLKMEEFIDSPQNELDKISDFLGIPQFKTNIKIKEYSGLYENQMTEKEADFLLAYFYKEICTLEKLLDWDCSDWLASARRLPLKARN